MNTEPPDLNNLFRQCSDNFRQFILALGYRTKSLPEPESSSTPSEYKEFVEEAADGFGKLQIWADNFRVNLPDNTRSSLGDRLRHPDNLEWRDHFVGRLESLNTQITLARSIVAGGVIKEDVDVDPDGASDSDTSSNDSSEDGRGPLPRLLKGISEDIGLLYSLGALIRRPRVSRRYLKSGSAAAIHPNKDPFLGISPDISHIRETIRRWQNARLQSEISLEEEREVSWEDILQRNEAQAEDGGPEMAIVERLAHANTRRRDQLIYWRQHPDRAAPIPEEGLVTNTVDTAIPNQPGNAPKPSVNDNKSVRSTATSLFSRDTVAMSDILGPTAVTSRIGQEAHESSRHFSAVTTYTETVVGGSHSARVPDVPAESGLAPTFECPYCHLELDSMVMTNRVAWKRHVFRDLRPYICLHPTCPNPDKLHATRHGWVSHEMQVHRRQWSCPECFTTFLSREDISAHITAEHAASPLFQTSTATAKSLLDLCEQEMDGSTQTNCCLCQSSSSLRSMLTHMARHMEELSLFALPKLEETDEENGSVGTKGSDDTVNQSEGSGTQSIDIDENQSIQPTSTSLSDPDTLTSMANLALTYRNQGRYQEAEKLEVQVMETSKMKLGADHPDTLTSMANLASIYRIQGRREEAEKLEVQVMETHKANLAADHPDTLTSMANLASTYRN